jgi:hypothetical protein
MKTVDPQKVFVRNGGRATFKVYLNPNRVCQDTMDMIDTISEGADMTKAEVVRYCVEFALANADWFEAAHMKRDFK